jgi:hypothetical protein
VYHPLSCVHMSPAYTCLYKKDIPFNKQTHCGSLQNLGLLQDKNLVQVRHSSI